MSNEPATKRQWTREEVEEAFKEILMDALGVEKDKVVPEASLIHDLGAESIDFLDIGFRVQQTFGVELPNKAIQEKALSWRNLGELRAILEERYRISLATDELRQMNGAGIREVLQRVASKKGFTVVNGEAEEIAAELAERLVREVESVGFRAPLIDKDDVMKLFLENLNSPQIMEGMIRLFSVGALVDFISGKVEASGT